MTKLAFVVITLVPEAANQSDNQIENEISNEIRMPWLAKVENTTVLEIKTYNTMPDIEKGKPYA